MSIARNTVYNIVGSALPMGVSLVTVPLYLSVVGLERYGVLSICWLLTGYFGLFDLGLGRATAQKIASLNASAPGERSAVFWTAIWLNVALSAVAAVIFIPASLWALNMMQFSSPAVRGEVAGAVPWLAATVPLTLLSSVLSGALEGRERFFSINVVRGLGSVLMAVAPLVVAMSYGPALWMLIAASLGARALTVVLFLVDCIEAVPVLRARNPDRALIGSLASYGGWITVSSVVGPLLAAWDRFAIGVVLGAAAVSQYVVPFNLVWQVVVIPAALGGALFPRLARSSAADVDRLQDDSVAAMSVVMTPLTVAIILAVGPFLRLWVGSEVGDESLAVAYIVLAGIWANAFARVVGTVLAAQGRPSVLAKLLLVQLPPYGLLLWAAMALYGVQGAALAWTLRCVADTLLLFAFRRSPALRRLFLPTLVVTASVVTAVLLPLWSPLRWALLAALLLVSISLAVRQMPPQISTLLRSFQARLMGPRPRTDG